MHKNAIFNRLSSGVSSAFKEEGQEWERFCLFALLPSGKIQEGWMNFHLLIWKQLIALLVRIELEGETYDEKAVWGPAWARMERKILALKTKVDEDVRRCEARGEQPRDMSKRSKAIAPIAGFSCEGELLWDDELVEKIKDKFSRVRNRKRGRQPATGGRTDRIASPRIARPKFDAKRCGPRTVPPPSLPPHTPHTQRPDIAVRGRGCRQCRMRGAGDWGHVGGRCAAGIGTY